jgi:hypothetical protein
MKKLVLIFTMIFVLSSLIAYASTTVFGSWTSTCWELSEAQKYAPRPSYSKMKKAIGCRNYKYEYGEPECKPCRNGQWKCRGTAQVWCE